MQHARDDHRPELDEAGEENGALAPDLAVAFFAALDEGESAISPPPPGGQASHMFDPVPQLAAADVLPAAQLDALIDAPPAAPLAAVPDVPALAPFVAEDATPDPPLDLEEFIVFSLADTRCVVPIRNVVEVGRIPESASVPHAPAWLHGLGNLRGQVLSLIDLRAFLGLGRIRPSAGRMIVLRADADEVVAGVMVDQVHQIVQLAPSRFQPAPSTLPPGYGGFVWGVCEYGLHMMVGLDVDGVLGAEAAHGESALPV